MIDMRQPYTGIVSLVYLKRFPKKKKMLRQAQLLSCKGNWRGKHNPHKIMKRCLAYDVTMTSQQKHVIRLLETIQAFTTFHFDILIVTIHRFVLCMQENQKRAIPLQYIF